jgi:hypothetical protein
MLLQVFNLPIEAAAKHWALARHCLCVGGPNSAPYNSDIVVTLQSDHTALHLTCTVNHCMPQVFNLPIEEAAKHLGIGQTMLKHYCRKFGIPRWPYRKRQSVVQLITSIEEYSTVRGACSTLVYVAFAAAWCGVLRAMCAEAVVACRAQCQWFPRWPHLSSSRASRSTQR